MWPAIVMSQKCPGEPADDEDTLEEGAKMKKTEIFEQVFRVMREDSSTKKDIMGANSSNIECITPDEPRGLSPDALLYSQFWDFVLCLVWA